MDVAQNTIAVVLQTSVGLGGVLLVFMGFVYARAESMSNTKNAERYKNVARGGILPLGIALWCAWLCMNYLQGDTGAYGWAIYTMRAAIVFTGLYAFIVLFLYM